MPIFLTSQPYLYTVYEVPGSRPSYLALFIFYLFLLFSYFNVLFCYSLTVLSRLCSLIS